MVWVVVAVKGRRKYYVISVDIAIYINNSLRKIEIDEYMGRGQKFN